METFLARSVLYALVLLLGVVLYRRWRMAASPEGLVLPPGPPPLPIIGNALEVSPNTPWLNYTAWFEQHGPLVYARLLGKDVIIISSEELVQDLIEKRPTIYNDRPHYVTNEFFGLSFNSGFLPYGDQWRLHRRMLHQTFRAAAIPDKMHPIMLRKRKGLVEAIIDSPEECLVHLREHATSVIMATVYGYETQPKNDRLVHVVERMLTFSMRAMTPEREVLASAFPIVKYIPTWMPGSQFRRDALQCRVYCKEMLEAPFECTVNAMASGCAPPSMTSDLLSSYARRGNPRAQEAIMGCTSTAFGAGSGTTNSSLLCFILAMVLYPHVQRCAQAEIDAIVAMDRLPDFGDRPSLPYIDAVLREVWRWRPINPISVPHATSRSDVYRQYYIPKGAMVLVNIWAISRSEKYPNPELFLPERFLSESGTLTEDEVQWRFGAGRRKCVGRYFADALVWSTAVTLLSCFEFSKEEGWGINDVEWTSGVTVGPHPFPVKVTVRERAKTMKGQSTL